MSPVSCFLCLLLFLLFGQIGIAQPQPFAVQISFGHTDPEEVNWSGSVSADQASITSLEGWLFLPADSIAFDTFEISAGGPLNKGLALKGTAAPEGRISIVTNRGSFSFPLSSLLLGHPVRFLEGAARVERLADAVKLTDDFRDDDYPSIAVASDSTAWAVWQSYSGQLDEVHISKYDGRWHPLTRLPGVSGDVWRPQVALDGKGRPMVVWSQQVRGNFDLYARTLDPESNFWLQTTRLTSHPGSDIDHHLISGQEGDLWVVWQGFQGDNSDIFLRRYDGAEWSKKVRITEHSANDWEPRIVIGEQGKAYIVWDTYRNGNYDVYMRSYQKGDLGPLVPIAATPRFEAHASVAIDGQNRIWVAWDEAGPNWGKDFGPTIDPNWRESLFSERLKHSPGLPVYDLRTINLIVLDGELRKTPVGDFHPLDAAKGDSYDYPRLLVDRPTNRVGLLFHRRGHTGPRRRGQVYWETVLTFYKEGEWGPILAMPQSWGRNSSRPAADYGPDGELWLAWPTDGRLYQHSHRPIVGNVYTARLPLDSPGEAPALEPWTGPKLDEVKPGHLNEPRDVKAIRSYRTFVHGVEKRIVRARIIHKA